MKPGDRIYWWADCGNCETGMQEPSLISGIIFEVRKDGSIITDEGEIIQDNWIDKSESLLDSNLRSYADEQECPNCGYLIACDEHRGYPIH